MEQTDAPELAHFFLAVGFTHRFSLQLRVSWRRWGFVSWQLPPRHMDKGHLKGTRDQGVVCACLFTRMEHRTSDRTGKGPEANINTRGLAA